MFMVSIISSSSCLLLFLTEPRVNKPPVVVVSPEFQAISLPISSTVIDGSRESLQEPQT